MKINFILFAIVSLGLHPSATFATPKKDFKSLLGQWNVISVGFDCVNTAWVQDQYEPKNGKIIGAKIDAKRNSFSWGKLKCRSPKYSLSNEDTLDFFTGDTCHESPGQLPEECSKLMEKLKGSKIETYELDCEGSEFIPRTFSVLSKEYLLAIVDADFICLKLVH